MPGIVGVISKKPAHECERLVRTMTGSMLYEPFYCSGMYSVPEMGIYAGWVAHEKSFAASQVFTNESGEIALLFSGECFADFETLNELRRKGHRLGEDSGDWLVHLYEEEEDRFFEKLNGLFSGLLIDKRRNRSFLFNDRYGVERIYWHETKDAIYCASEAKALLRILPQLREFDPDGVAQFLAFGCTTGSRTLFRGIELLPGGSLWTFEARHYHEGKYFSPAEWESQRVLPPKTFISRFEATFKKILPRYFESNSRIGISLTGGLDSRMIMACLPGIEKQPICYTFAGDNRDTLDVRLASRVARECGLPHEVLRIEPDFFSHFASYTDQTIYTTDGYLGPLGAHEIYVNRRARLFAPVRLTGNYGSEVLRDVSTFKFLRLSPRLISPNLLRQIRCSARCSASNNRPSVTFAAFREIPWKRFGVLAAGRSQSIFRTPYLDNEIVALAFQAPEVLRMSSAPATHLVRNSNPALAKIPGDMGQIGLGAVHYALLWRLFSKASFKLDYLYNEGLPHQLSRFDLWIRRPGCGVGLLGLHKFVHYRSWFQRELGAYVDATLSDVRNNGSQFWNSDFLETMARDHRAGRKNYVLEINAVLTLEGVERLLFRGLPRESQRTGGLTVSTPAASVNKEQSSNLVNALSVAGAAVSTI